MEMPHNFVYKSWLEEKLSQAVGKVLKSRRQQQHFGSLWNEVQGKPWENASESRLQEVTVRRRRDNGEKKICE